MVWMFGWFQIYFLTDQAVWNFQGAGIVLFATAYSFGQWIRWKNMLKRMNQKFHADRDHSSVAPLLPLAMMRALAGAISSIALCYVVCVICGIWDAGKFLSAVQIPQLFLQLFFTSDFWITVNDREMWWILIGIWTILGAVLGGTSVLWRKQEWGLTKVTAVHFLITSFVLLPIAYICDWMRHSVVGFMEYFCFFLVVYVIFWGIQTGIWKRKIGRINRRLGEEEKG